SGVIGLARMNTGVPQVCLFIPCVPTVRGALRTFETGALGPRRMPTLQRRQRLVSLDWIMASYVIVENRLCRQLSSERCRQRQRMEEAGSIARRKDGTTDSHRTLKMDGHLR